MDHLERSFSLRPLELRMDRVFFEELERLGANLGSLSLKTRILFAWQIRRGADSGRTLTSKTLFKLDEVFLGALFSVHDGTGVILSDYAFRSRLNGRWGEVGFINEFGREML